MGNLYFQHFFAFLHFSMFVFFLQFFLESFDLCGGVDGHNRQEVQFLLSYFFMF